MVFKKRFVIDINRAFTLAKTFTNDRFA